MENVQAPLPLFVQSMPSPQAFPDILDLEPSVPVRLFVYGNSGLSLE